MFDFTVYRFAPSLQIFLNNSILFLEANVPYQHQCSFCRNVTCKIAATLHLFYPFLVSLHSNHLITQSLITFSGAWLSSHITYLYHIFGTSPWCLTQLDSSHCVKIFIWVKRHWHRSAIHSISPRPSPPSLYLGKRST